MNEYKEIRKIFGYFPVYTQETINDYRREVREGITYGWINLEILDEQISQALNDKEFSWKALAKEKQAIFYSDAKSELQIFMSFQLHTWDLLFPNKSLSNEEMQILEEEVLAILNELNPENEWMDVNELIKQLENKYINLEYYHLIKLKYDVAQHSIEFIELEQGKLYIRRLDKVL